MRTGWIAPLIVACFFLGCDSGGRDKACYQDRCINVEIVSSDEDRMKGLQDRKKMEDDNGMLFVFPFLSRHSFWMKDTYIPLDIIWLDHSKRVVHVEENVQPCKLDPCPTYTPAEKALYVLEVNAHRAKEWGIKKGVVLEIRLSESN